MKKIKFTCTNCDAKLRVPTHLAGVSAPCPRCGATITAPSDISYAVEDDHEPRRAGSSGSVRSNRQEVVSPSPGGPRANPGAVSTATAVLSKSPATFEVPTPVSRPLQSRPLMQPAASEPPATVLFDPPPPVRSITPVPAETDSRSDAPISLPPMPPLPLLPPVVVEISDHPVPSPAPLIPIITQPIQLNSRPRVLPESPGEVPGAGSLPRLDVSLAGQDLSAAAALLFSEGGGQQAARTRVQLPQPGVETHKFSPNDFIVPVPPPVFSSPSLGTPEPHFEPIAAPDEETHLVQGTQNGEILLPIEDLAAPPQHRYSPISFPTEAGAIPLEEIDSNFVDPMSESYDSGDVESFVGDDFSFQNTLFPGQPDPDAVVPGLEMPQWNEDELAGAPGAVETDQIPWNSGPEVSLSQGIASRPLPEEWHRGKTQPVPPLFSTVTEEAAPGNFYEGAPSAPLNQGNFGKLFSQQVGNRSQAAEVPSEAPTEISGEDRDEVDVLEKLFGDRPRERADSKGLSKTAIMMISCLVGAGILAAVVVFFFFESFGGGFNVAESYGTDTEVVVSQPAAAQPKATEPLEEPSLADAPAVIDPVALIRESAANNPDTRGVPTVATADAPPSSPSPGGAEAPALSFDERVQRVVNGTDGANGTGTGAAGGGSASLNVVDDAISRFNGSVDPAGVTPLVAPALQSPPAAPTPAAVEAPPIPTEPSPAGPISPAAGSLTNSPAAKSTNYNPAAVFPAPGPNESSLLRTNDVIDAFLRAPDAQTRVKYTFQGPSLQAAIEDYYKKWPDKPIERYSLQLFQMEQSTELGGPYWVYLVSTSDMDQGFPLIVRVEEGNLKVDWEIYSEFYDRHFVRYREHKLPSPATFRLVIERVTGYYGSDLKDFKSLNEYQVYQVNPPYGDLNEFSENAFVKKGSELAKKLDKVVGLGDEPLAVIITLDEKALEHGVKHYLITEYLTEGWFR